MNKPGKFAVIGLISTLTQYLFLVVAVELTSWRPHLASGAGFAVAAAINYALNYRYTFRSTAAHGGAILRFVLMAATGLALNTAFMWALVESAGLPYLPGQLLTTALVLVWNYVLSDRWVYRHDGGSGN